MSIPTSLIVVILVAAWLAVLVPMVARRREQVPETETAGSTFRVLRRASVLGSAVLAAGFPESVPATTWPGSAMSSMTALWRSLVPSSRRYML